MLQLGRKAKVACNGLIFAPAFFYQPTPVLCLVSVGTMGIWRVSPDGSDSELIDFDGQNVVNFTFGLGDDARTLFTIINGDAGLTGKAGGKILAVKWDSRGVSFGD
nr:hypothetical protein [uncultured Cohaesibacter sp.]